MRVYGQAAEIANERRRLAVREAALDRHRIRGDVS